MTELLSCPFCGGKAHSTPENRATRMAERVTCLSCCVELDGHGSIEHWNARTQSTPEPVQGEAVEVVGWRRADRPYEMTAYPSVCSTWHRHGFPVQALYTSPAKPDAELVELLRAKFPRIDPCQPVPLDEKAHCCEYTIYVERERLHRLIDARYNKGH